MSDHERLRSELEQLATGYVASVGLRERTEGRIRQRRQRRRAGVIGAAALLVVGVVAVPALLRSDPDDAVFQPEPPTDLDPDQPAEGGCTGEAVLSADLDGDGRPDEVSGRWVDADGETVAPGAGEFELEVCTAAGKRRSIVGVGNETIRAIDIEGDGRAELLVGGTSASAAFLEVVVLVDGSLEVVLAEGRPLGLRELTLAADATGVPVETAALGCEDLTGDGHPELVQVTATFTSTEAAWTKQGFTLTGAAASPTQPESGAEPFVGDRISYPAMLTTACRDVSTDAGAAVSGDYVVAPAEWPTAGLALRTETAIVFYDDAGTELGTVEDPQLLAGLDARSGLAEITVEPTIDGASFAAAAPQPVDAVPSCTGATGAGGVRVALCRTGSPFTNQIQRAEPDGSVTLLSEEPPDGGEGGFWLWAVPSPDGSWVLAQWSGECEIPVSYLIPASGGVPQAVVEGAGGGSTASIAGGWTSDGRALVTFPAQPACGASPTETGSYLIDPTSGERSLLSGDADRGYRWRQLPRGNAAERTISRALQELGLEGCCGEPSEGSPQAASGAVWQATRIPIHGSPIHPPGEPYVWFNDLVIDSQPSDLDGLPITIGTADMGSFLAFTCGEHVWSLGGYGIDGDRADPDDLRSLATVLVERLYCTVGRAPLATGHG